MTDQEFQDFICRTGDELDAKQDLLSKSFGLGQFSKFWFDQPSGKLQFKNDTGGVEVEAVVTPIGSFSRKDATWQWAWANKSILEPLRFKAEKLKELTALTEIESFKLPALNSNEEMAWEMAAMAVHVLGSVGCYKMPAGELEVFVGIDSIKRIP
jgi:hypothetical protein